MSGKKIYITLDTEMDADIHWIKPFPPQFTSVVEGIPRYFRPLWDKYKINPIYFVSPEVVKNSACCKVLKNEIEKGAIIGAHLHPEYIAPYCKTRYTETKEALFPCYDCDTKIEEAKLRNLTNLIEKNLGVKPKWYRAARFGADIDTIKILKKLGYEFDSSITPEIDWSSKGGPNHCLAPKNPYQIDDNNFYKQNDKGSIREYPVTIMGKRGGILGCILPNKWLFYKWLRPTHMFLWEEKKIIRSASKNKMNDLVLMFHSMEVMINKTPYVRNRLMQRYFIRRLDRTIAYAAKLGYKSV